MRLYFMRWYVVLQHLLANTLQVGECGVGRREVGWGEGPRPRGGHRVVLFSFCFVVSCCRRVVVDMSCLTKERRKRR